MDDPQPFEDEVRLEVVGAADLRSELRPEPAGDDDDGAAASGLPSVIEPEDGAGPDPVPAFGFVPAAAVMVIVFRPIASGVTGADPDHVSPLPLVSGKEAGPPIDDRSAMTALTPLSASVAVHEMSTWLVLPAGILSSTAIEETTGQCHEATD